MNLVYKPPTMQEMAARQAKAQGKAAEDAKLLRGRRAPVLPSIRPGAAVKR